MKKQHVVILGGGFGGIKAALTLCRDDRFDVTVVSENDCFRYYPALYHTATGGSREISNIPLSELFADKPITFVRARATKLNRTDKKITTKGGGTINYDTLIIALGMTTNYFGIEGLEEFSYGVKSIEQAEELKAHIHTQMIAEHKPDLHYLVVGGGPTGVELAGELPHYLHKIMEQHGIKHRKINVDLIEAAPRILPRLPKDTGRMTARQLRRLGVKIHVNQKVEAETAEALIVNGQPIESKTVIWTAGVTCNPFLTENGFTMTEHRKVAVDEFLQAEHDIYVIGDNADTLYSGVAQTALHDGKFVAENLIRVADGGVPRPYKPRRPVYVTPTGTKWASVVWGSVRLYGWLGWVLRRFADLFAYHDYEPWWPAGKRWVADIKSQESCPICSE